MSVPDPAAAGKAAIAARRERAELKRALREGETDALTVLQQAGSVRAAASLRVSELLRTLPGFGPKRVTALLENLAIAPSKRLGGLGRLQRERLHRWLADATTQDARDVARLIVLAGPTAVGKGTVAQYVRDHFPDIRHSVSATTRAPRAGEIDGVHYRFIDDAHFDAMIAADEFLEWATVHNRHRYGTPRGDILWQLGNGTSVLLEIDLQGARQVRERMPEAVLVFLAPPSWDELVRRLVGRGTEGEEERERRLATARVELASQNEFDAIVINNDVATAAAEVVALVRGSRDVR